MERFNERNPFTLSDAATASPERRRRYALHLMEVRLRLQSLERLDAQDGLSNILAEVEEALAELEALEGERPSSGACNAGEDTPGDMG